MASVVSGVEALHKIRTGSGSDQLNTELPEVGAHVYGAFHKLTVLPFPVLILPC